MANLRNYLADKFESEKFLDELLVEVIKNEDNFKSSLAQNAFDNCLAIMRRCNVIVILYNGEAGWAPSGTPMNGICHEEFIVAMNDFSEMSYMMDLSGFFKTKASGDEEKRNERFVEDINRRFPHKETIAATTVDELQKKVLKQITKYLLTSIEKAFDTQKRQVAASSTFGPTLDWSKYTYDERQKAISQEMKKQAGKLNEVKEIIKAYHAIPDNMSVADARNRIGRPFISEYKHLKNQEHQSGVIHFVGVYGNATSIQVKNLVGYPDIVAIKAPFGYYLWDQVHQTQIFFLVRCINPQAISTRFSELLHWLNGSNELSNIEARSKARYSILKAIEKSQELNNK